LWTLPLQGQNKITLQITDSIPNDVKYKRELINSSEIQIECKRIITQLIYKGFLLAAVDSTILKNDTVRLKIELGNSFRWGKVELKYLPNAFIKQFRFNQPLESPLQIQSLLKSMDETISFYENRGYPFAYFYWDSLRIKNDSLSGSLKFEKNIEITFDTIALIGEAGITKQFLYNYFQ
jgi:hypothetical protein